MLVGGQAVAAELEVVVDAAVGREEALPADSVVPSACVFVLFSSMAWSPPALKRRLWFVEQTRDDVTNLFPPHPRRHLSLRRRLC